VERLADSSIRGAMKPGMHPDGDGLYLQVRGASKCWIYRYGSGGRTRYLGLGAYPGVSLASARKARDKAKAKIQAGSDPIVEKRPSAITKPATVTFRQAVDDYIFAHQQIWRNAKHRQQWRNTLDTYAKPLMDRAVEAIDTMMVKSVLTAPVETRRGKGPLWTTLPETASRLRGRIEAVLDSYNAANERPVLNPARWKGHLEHVLAARRDVAAVKHHAAMSWTAVPEFMAKLHKQSGLGALALRFSILTAARTSEALGATWAELDMSEPRKMVVGADENGEPITVTAGALWMVPPDRMKGKREHRVPLSSAALDVLREALTHRTTDDPSAPIFPSHDGKKPLSNMTMTALLRRMGYGELTVHGFRSSFRDWVAEATQYQGSVAEAALAHTNGDKTEAAYQRSDRLEPRRRLMDDWAGYCCPAPTENVVRLEGRQQRSRRIYAQRLGAA
jgi:integrase